ncbi:16S rRNA (guanine(527)-N(7))-methyltransferase RsmG [[Acholeplasma] multilocale]|uniref:16S rRNA (guanine(527)-N(7))-methyltransferase RsmG n=1 Tax=[Acholeplasma] multilocale TaxID=264638 RepID=UPI00047DA30F|nr:16S rRNA (guanine(527)-N(7))-methyltransferase RsmG [[Acholeplasma] multilocale]
MFNNWEIFEGYKNFKLTEDIKEKLERYFEILTEENAKYNLTRITEENDVYVKHFLDSLLFTENCPITNQKIADIGTGAGFPGIVLKIFFPATEITLIESNNKKVFFLNLAIEKLGLTGITVTNERAEEFSVAHKEEFDIVVSRAVAYLDIILEIGVQLVKVGGLYITLKGPRADEEMRHLRGRDVKMGLSLTEKQILVDKGYGERINLFYTKTTSTNEMYPRTYSAIKKDSQ